MKKCEGFFKVAALAMVSCIGFATMTPAADACKAKILKSENKIREDGKGYVVPVATDPETKKCVDVINTKRRAKYESIAQKDNIPLEEVEKIAAQKLK
jgi:uncharacterized protein YdbL (DUF1318 family)